jgi:hypothetical protein
LLRDRGFRAIVNCNRLRVETLKMSIIVSLKIEMSALILETIKKWRYEPEIGRGPEQELGQGLGQGLGRGPE